MYNVNNKCYSVEFPLTVAVLHVLPAPAYPPFILQNMFLHALCRGAQCMLAAAPALGNARSSGSARGGSRGASGSASGGAGAAAVARGGSTRARTTSQDSRQRLEVGLQSFADDDVMLDEVGVVEGPRRMRAGGRGGRWSVEIECGVA